MGATAGAIVGSAVTSPRNSTTGALVGGIIGNLVGRHAGRSADEDEAEEKRYRRELARRDAALREEEANRRRADLNRWCISCHRQNTILGAQRCISCGDMLVRQKYCPGCLTTFSVASAGRFCPFCAEKRRLEYN